jgi:hypothetical protein
MINVLVLLSKLLTDKQIYMLLAKAEFAAYIAYRRVYQRYQLEVFRHLYEAEYEHYRYFCHQVTGLVPHEDSSHDDINWSIKPEISSEEILDGTSQKYLSMKVFFGSSKKLLDFGLADILAILYVVEKFQHELYKKLIPEAKTIAEQEDIHSALLLWELGDYVSNRFTKIRKWEKRKNIATLFTPIDAMVYMFNKFIL